MSTKEEKDKDEDHKINMMKKSTHSVGPEDESPSRSPDRPPLDSGLRLSRFSVSDPAGTSAVSPAHKHTNND